MAQEDEQEFIIRVMRGSRWRDIRTDGGSVVLGGHDFLYVWDKDTEILRLYRRVPAHLASVAKKFQDNKDELAPEIAQRKQDSKDAEKDLGKLLNKLVSTPSAEDLNTIQYLVSIHKTHSKETKKLKRKINSLPDGTGTLCTEIHLQLGVLCKADNEGEVAYFHLRFAEDVVQDATVKKGFFANDFRTVGEDGEEAEPTDPSYPPPVHHTGARSSASSSSSSSSSWKSVV